MPSYLFSVIVAAAAMDHEQILDVADTLAAGGCDDASARGHHKGMELLFERDADSLQQATLSAVRQIEAVGYTVLRVELEREAVCA